MGHTLQNPGFTYSDSIYLFLMGNLHEQQILKLKEF